MRAMRELAHARRIVAVDGAGSLAGRLLRRAGERLPPPPLDFRIEDIRGPVQPQRVGPLGSPPRVVVVMTPPSGQSGGHRTVMRIVEDLERHGFVVTICLYDAFLGDVGRHEPTIRGLFPAVRAQVRDAAVGLPDADAILATSWQTAHVIARGPAVGHRLYLVQDFEPWFYARGDISALAEDSYRLGFHGIAIGSWLARTLRDDYGMSCDSFPFGCDLDAYRRGQASGRSGIAFYARPSTPRRGFLLGMMALDIVRRARPDVDLHLFGERTGWSAFPVHDHGTLRVEQLADLYAGCAAGLVLSFTNVSLAPVEMLAAGCQPIVNDSPFARADLPLDRVLLAEPSPEALANALIAGIESVAHEESRHSSWAESLSHVRAAIAQRIGVTV